MSAPLAYPIDTAVVRGLFTGPGLTCDPGELEARLHRRGFTGPLADWLPTLREAGLREPRAGVFAPPVAETLKNSNLNPSNLNPSVFTAPVAENPEPVDAADNRNKAGIEQGDTDTFPPTAGADNRHKADIESTETAPGPPTPRFSYFRGGIRTAAPYAAITPRQLWDVLTGPQFAAATARLRAAPAGSEQRAEFKKCLDYVTPAGIFTRRANAGLAEPSGCMVLDFDHVPNLAAARAALLNDAHVGPALVLLFTSPGGEGLKALVATGTDAAHLDTFRALSAYLSHHYGDLGLTPDPSGKDVARACFVCHDPAAWLAPELAA